MSIESSVLDDKATKELNSIEGLTPDNYKEVMTLRIALLLERGKAVQARGLTGKPRTYYRDNGYILNQDNIVVNCFDLAHPWKWSGDVNFRQEDFLVFSRKEFTI